MYSGSSTVVSLRSWDVLVSFVSQDEGSLRDQQWFLSVGHVEGVDSGRDRRFIINFSKITHPWFLLLEKETKFIFDTFFF
ncbi:hypothetical protein MTR67_039510 [Solanum verrucosum]|uniref:Uncharacterized protein n=1 Tax=Solanum verrucosum TaxID=315347 RepID=A0AAF0UI24_SOLVR|nr:hypothetical protein MTR67_039510 [Solanum verrucosum]